VPGEKPSKQGREPTRKGIDNQGRIQRLEKGMSKMKRGCPKQRNDNVMTS